MNEVEWYRVDFSIKLRAINKIHAEESAIQYLKTQALRKQHLKKVTKIKK